jgi:glycosyltransferase involved in cell wall biosynthesis
VNIVCFFFVIINKKLNFFILVDIDLFMISIIVVCHNYGRFLEKCVKSILSNDRKFIKEILIIDDSSEDNTENIAYKLKKKNHLVKYFKKNFKSLSKSTNFGVKKSKSKWITKIDADDYISKNFLKVFFEELKRKKLDFIYGNLIEINRLNGQTRLINQNYSKNNILKYPMGSGTIFNKSVWKSVGGFNEKLFYQDDYEFWLKLKKKRIEIGYINKACYFYQKHSNNMSSNLIKKNLTKMYVLLKNIL